MPEWGRPPPVIADGAALRRSDAGEGTRRAPQRVPRRVQPGSVVTAAPGRCRAIFLEDLLQYSQQKISYNILSRRSPTIFSAEDLLQYSQQKISYNILSRRSPTIFSAEDLLQYSQ